MFETAGKEGEDDVSCEKDASCRQQSAERKTISSSQLDRTHVEAIVVGHK